MIQNGWPIAASMHEALSWFFVPGFCRGKTSVYRQVNYMLDKVPGGSDILLVFNNKNISYESLGAISSMPGRIRERIASWGKRMNTPAVRKIPTGLSLYLDLVRLLAAVFVVLHHTWSVTFPDHPFKWPGHEAVIVFFVLSGYVITHAAKAPGMNGSAYFQHRVARIIPGAYATLAFAACICWLWPDLYTGTDFWGDTLSNALFVAQSGVFFFEAPLHSPFWSLNYEVWYYIIFGVWVFAPRRWRAGLTILAMLLAGPKILMLFPVWLLGVLLYYRMPAWKPRFALACWLITIVAGFVLTWLDVSELLRARLYAFFPPAWHAHYSTQFLYDIPMGIVVAVHFTAIASLDKLTSCLHYVEKGIRYLASYTFTLYIFHNSLAVLIHEVFGISAPLPFYGLTALFVFVFAELTERRTGWYRAALARIGALLHELRETEESTMAEG